MKRLLILVLILFVGCSGVQRTVKKAIYGNFSTISEIYSYRILITKLPAGSIPDNSVKVSISDSTKISFSWLQVFESKPYEDQKDPSVYGSSSDTTVITVMNDDVIYDTPNQSESIVNYNDLLLQLSEGEYQVQVSSSVYSTKENRAIFSKKSDATGFYAIHPSDPPMVPTSVNIRIN